MNDSLKCSNYAAKLLYTFNGVANVLSVITFDFADYTEKYLTCNAFI
jgi:hypothetical protein